MRIIIRLVTIGFMSFLLIIPAFNINDAIKNTKDYIEIRNNIKKCNNEISKCQNGIDEGRKAIKDYRSKDLVDLEHANGLYKAVKALPEVTNIEANIISISGNNIKVMGEFDIDKLNAKIPGVQLIVSTKDVNKFLEGLKKLKTPYTTLNVIYPENKVVIRYNTQGGSN